MYNHATICTQSQKTEGGTKSAVDLTPHHQENLVWQLFLIWIANVFTNLKPFLRCHEKLSDVIVFSLRAGTLSHN